MESDENFSEDENSQVLFESTQDVRNIEHLASLTDDTSGEDTDDENSEEQQIFRTGYNLRGKQKKPRNSYSPPIPTQQRAAQGTSQHRKSSISRVKTYQQHK